jgi:hypothetical protein
MNIDKNIKEVFWSKERDQKDKLRRVGKIRFGN